MSLAEVRLVLVSEPDSEVRDKIHQQIRAFNDATSEHHRAVRQAGPNPLDVFLRDVEENLLGGLVASTYWRWLDIDDLWLEESLRRRGYGRRLLAEAETEAIRRGCLRAFVRTFGFQAKGFYEKQGYRVVGRLDDYPPGQAFFWMCKELVSSDEKDVEPEAA